mmetsp:Transcript_1930/g.3076  ORF Transcript_1930/g.3076 Transcript_1930/m.3076 type:complete len:251 (-) Transcript_1930:197-949(-)
MFMSRLDEARTPVSNAKIPEIKKTPGTGKKMMSAIPFNLPPEDETKENKSDSGADNSSNDRKLTARKEYKDESEILEKLSEYLFDLFDANCMEDYATMEEFEVKALESFRNFEEKEYTHQQHALHNEFVELFEKLIEKFLRTEGYSVEVFYDELLHFMKQQPATGSRNLLVPQLSPNEKNAGKRMADECMEVISGYMKFDIWADMMRQQAKQQFEFKTMKQKLHDVAAAVSSAYSADNKSAAHRLDDCVK